MSVLNLGSLSPQRVTLSEDTTAYNPDTSVSVLVGDTPSPDTPIPPQGAFTLSGGRTYWFQRADGSPGQVDLLRGLTGAIPSPIQIATGLTNSGLASAIASDMIAAGVAKDTSLTGLAKDTSVVAVNTTLGSPAQKTDVNQVNTTLGAPAQETGNLQTAKNLLAGTATGALISGAGRTVAQETAALIASGSAAGAPGGTPLLHGIATIIGPATSFNIPAGSSVNTGALIPIDKPGYEIALSLTVAGASNNPMCLVTARWFDPSGGVQIFRTDWIVMGTTNGSVGISGQGPTRGSFIQLTFTNLDTVNAETIAVTLMETTHHIAREDWRTQSLNATPPSFLWAAGANPPENILASFNQQFAGAATVSRLLPLYAGQAWINATFNPTVGGQNASFVIQPITLSVVLEPFFNSDIATTVGGLIVASQPVTLPRIPCIVTMISPAGGATFNISLIEMEYAS